MILGTDISCTQENLYRITRSLFPPNLSVLKEICWRGYIDGLKFLQTRSKLRRWIFLLVRLSPRVCLDMIKSSHLSAKTSISLVLGDDYTEPRTEDERELRHGGMVQDLGEMYADSDGVEGSSSDEDGDESSSESVGDEEDPELNPATFSPFCEKITRKKELPTPLFAGTVRRSARTIDDDVSRCSFRRRATEGRRSDRRIFHRIECLSNLVVHDVARDAADRFHLRRDETNDRNFSFESDGR